MKALRFYRPDADSPEIKYLQARRAALGGYLPARSGQAPRLSAPAAADTARLIERQAGREQSTTMVFVAQLTQLLRDTGLGRHVVPIVADEARTFGMQSLFREFAIYAAQGQLYEPEDRDELLHYKESKDGQILEEGICEAGAMASWIAAATSYSTHGVPMLPAYIFYSCFGFQRVGDLIFCAADSRARGFLIGATAGRTTLSGEGLQHQDGSSLLAASAIPNCRAWDPAFGYELATLVAYGTRRMLEEQRDEFHYLTVMNENYAQPALPAGVSEADIVSGLYRLPAHAPADAQVRLVGAGTILREAIEAARLLEADFGVRAEVWSATSFVELSREARAVQRENRLQPGAARASRVAQCLAGTLPVVAATDYVRAVPQLVAEYVGAPYTTLGTDGFGRSGTRRDVRRFFEVDRGHIVLAALAALVRAGAVPADAPARAIEKYALARDAAAPWRV